MSKRSKPARKEGRGDAQDASIDWRNVFNPQKIKAILQENPNIGVLPTKSVDLISASSALFIRDLVESAKSLNDSTTTIKLCDLKRAVKQNEQFAFLSSTLTSIAEGGAASLHLLPKKRPATSAGTSGPSKTSKRQKKLPALKDASVAEAIRVADEVGADRNAIPVRPMQREIQVDEEDYD